jgi:hypothetical protein
MKLLDLACLVLMPAIVIACTERGAQAPGDPASSPVSAQAASADPTPAAAQGGRPVTLEVNNLRWLTANSPFVFVGRSSGKTPERDARGLIVTKHRFDVENTIVGQSPEKVVTLTILGGTAGGETMKMSHMPEFVQGQRYVVFTDLKRTVYNPITGNQNGVFRVTDGAVYTYDGRGLLGVDNAGLLQVSDVVLLKEPSDTPERTAASRAGDPTVSGGRVSTDRAAGGPARPMSLDEFSRAILAASRR